MADIQEQVNDICRLADAVVYDPSTSLLTTAKKIGVSTAVASGVMAFAPIAAINPLLAAGIWIVKKARDKEKERQEKERMLREVIRKQQAVINKLNEELARSRQQNAQNRQEIENLKKMLKLLEEAEEHLNAA